MPTTFEISGQSHVATPSSLAPAFKMKSLAASGTDAAAPKVLRAPFVFSLASTAEEKVVRSADDAPVADFACAQIIAKSALGSGFFLAHAAKIARQLAIARAGATR